MSDSISRIRSASPARVARLLDLSESASKVWRPDELGAVFKHQMQAPVDVDLGAFNFAEAHKLQALAAGSGLTLTSFSDLFRHAKPPLKLLDMVKEFAKRNRGHQMSAIPEEIATVLYYLSIAAALVRWDERISALKDQELASGFDWALRQPWIDVPSRDLLAEARARLPSAPGSGQPAAPAQ